MKKSFFWKIAIPYVLMILVVMALSTWLVSSFFTNTFQNTMQENLLAEARLIANESDSLILENRLIELEQLISDQAKAAEIRITIIQPDGRVLAESDLNPASLENHLDRPEVQNALNGEESTEIRFSNTLLTRMLYAAVPIAHQGKIIGIARLAMPIRSIEGNIQSVNRVIWGLSGMIILVAIAIAIIITAHALQPLRRLTEKANEISKVNPDETILSSKKDEIGQMSDAFHRMAESLDQQIRDFKLEQTKLSAILDTMTDGIFLVDGKGYVQLSNPAARKIFEIKTGLDSLATLIATVRDHQIVELWEKCLREKSLQSQTLEISPERYTIQCIAAPLGEAMPDHVLILFQDFTQLKKLEVIRRDFVSNVSHELRTPLASFKALAETLKQSALKDKKASQKFLSMMEIEIDNLIQMVEEQLELSKIESGKVPLVLEKIQPMDLISKSINRMRVQAERAGLELLEDLEKELPPILVDAGRIEQVMVNLIHNAIKFTPPKGRITVSVKRVENQVIFSIRDTGQGISEKDIPRIFERFYKTDKARTGGGTGLGLSIARHIIEAHGGKIWVESKLGEGSTFYFALQI